MWGSERLSITKGYMPKRAKPAPYMWGFGGVQLPQKTKNKKQKRKNK